jgi:hypothetical protein
MRVASRVTLGVSFAMLVAVASLATAAARTGAGGGVAGWIYIDSDNGTPNKNTVVAIPYSNAGIPLTKQAKQYPTGGTGSLLVLPVPNSAGTTAGDHQVLLSSDNKLLFAVNQGSNSIAVFHVNSATGALTPVDGSPFFSGGLAPVALGLAHNILVVANHGIIGPFNPLGPSPPGPSNLVSFRVSPGGALKEISATPPAPDGLIDATTSPSGRVIVTTGFFPEVVPGKPFPKRRTCASMWQLTVCACTPLVPAVAMPPPR